MISFLFACKHLQRHLNAAIKNDPVITFNATDPDLNFKNGYWYYKSDLFSGTILEHFENNAVHKKTQYLQGRENGWQIIFYPGGSLSEKRFYTNGEKDIVHTGWWPNGNMRFEYHFAKGIYDGDYKEWYETGEQLKYIHYTKGVDDWGKGWRQNGKLYMNFVVRNGRRYGLNNSNLCYTVKNGSGELIASVKENK